MDLETGLQALLVVSVVSAAAPFVCALLARLRVPQVVVLIVGGVLIGPEVGGLAEPESIELVANVGLGFLFLLAGYELELDHFRERSGRLAVAGWVVSAVVSIGVTGLLAAAGLVHAFVPVALALTTTALGTLLPILRDNDMLDGPLGRFIMPAGAVGEFLPIVGIAIFLGSQGRLFGLVSLVVMCAVALALAWLPRLARLRPVRGDLPAGRARDVADHPAADRDAAVRPAGVRQRRRAGRGARRVPRRRGPAPVGSRRRRRPGGQAGRGRVRVLHPGLLRLLRHEPGPRLHQGGAGAAGRPSSCCCSRCADFPRSSSTAATWPCASGSR